MRRTFATALAWLFFHKVSLSFHFQFLPSSICQHRAGSSSSAFILRTHRITLNVYDTETTTSSESSTSTSATLSSDYIQDKDDCKTKISLLSAIHSSNRLHKQHTHTRRRVITQLMLLAAGVASSACLLPTSEALASGGATAGRYTTIPIAKRRYYGRVQEAVHEFLLFRNAKDGNRVVMNKKEEAALLDLGSESIVRTFFDPSGIVVVAAKRSDVNGQCTKRDNDCRGKEIRDSRYNDMKASMYLLANAFRTDQQKPPDRLPTVKAAKAFFKEVNELEKIVQSRKSDSVTVKDAAVKYSNALRILDDYLDLVELPPVNSGHYDEEFDTLVGDTARIT